MARKPATSFRVSRKTNASGKGRIDRIRNRRSARAKQATDAEVIPLADLDDAPAWTQDQLDRAEIAIGGKVSRAATGTLTRGPGRPRSDNPKKQVSVRLDPDLLDALRGDGPGWQGRMNDILRKALKLG